MHDYFAVEPLIVARLKECLAEATVQSTWGMPKLQETSDLPPSVLVFLEEDRPGQIADDGITQKVEQVWLCLVVVSDAESEAGPLIARVIKAMAGWQPDDPIFSPFHRVKSHFAPDYSPNGIYYFPLAFSTHFVFNV